MELIKIWLYFLNKLNKLSIFQNFINDTLNNYLNNFIIIYFNNIFIYSKNKKNYIKYIKKML